MPGTTAPDTAEGPAATGPGPAVTGPGPVVTVPASTVPAAPDCAGGPSAAPARSARTRSIHDTIRGHAARTPDAVAVVHGARRMAFRELDEASDACARRLMALGVGPGVFVPVRLPRSAALPVVLLGVLKAGAAYSLIDARWPDERVREVLRQTGASVFVTDDAVPEGLPGSVRVWSPAAEPVVEADGPGPLPAPFPEVTGADAACVFFTSGSTGAPKGAVSPHSGVVRLLAEGGLRGFGPDMAMPLVAAMPWDLFSLELWGPLLSGGTVVVVDEPYLSGDVLRDLVRRDGATTVWTTTSLFNMLVDEDPGCFTGLRTVMLGGERVSPPHVAAFLAAYPGIDLINGYGPVESTVFTTTHVIRPEDCRVRGGVPIGTPVPRTRVYVLDGDVECPDGTVGELCFAGEGLALGYLGRPDLTEERFPTLLLGGRRERVYRSGDLGLRDADGILHYRGRSDRQVKVRGQRIEPEEVETVVCGLPGVARCVVLPARAPDGACTGLLAFATPAEGASPLAADDLLARLRTLVPAYQVPDSLTEVASIPLTANGKLDTAALLALVPEAGAVPTTAPAVPGGDAALFEQPAPALVGQVFADVTGLTLAQIPGDASLAQLGATSLDAGRVAARLGQALGRPVPVSQVFATPSVRALSRWIEDTAVTAAGPGHDEPAPAADEPVALTPLQTYFLVEHLANPDDVSQHCVAGWRIAGRPNRRTLRAAAAYVHQRHSALGRRFVLDDPPVAVPTDTPVPPVREFVVGTEKEARAVLARELARPFRLEAAYIWQLVFVAVREAPVTYVGVAAHHIVFDGTSTAVLAADLGAVYRAMRLGQEPELPPAPGPAQVDGVRRAHLAYTDRAGQEAHWRTTLEGLPDLDFPGAPAPGGPASAVMLQRQVPEKAVAGTVALAARSGVSAYAAYLSAYGDALQALTGQRDFGVLTPVSLRGDAVLERAVNCLINPVCLRLRPDPQATPAAQLAATGAVVAGAFAAQDLSLPEIVGLLGVRADGERAPLAQTMFALQDTPLPVLDLGDVGAEIVLPAYPAVSEEVLADMWPDAATHPYPGAPAEVLTEVWPSPDGGARVLLAYQPRKVTAEFAERLLTEFVATLSRYAERPDER